MFKTPVLLLIHKRSDTTKRVFNKIRDIQPEKFFVAADGPRPDYPDEPEKCRAARSIVNQIDWNCELKTLFQDKNLGCGLGPATGIDWFFENVEQGIILEDDCLPGKSFFHFCEELLNLYKHDTRIMHITGTNSHLGSMPCNYSYYYSKLPGNWGWATWRRAWRYFDYDMKRFPMFENENMIHSLFPDKEQADYQLNKYRNAYNKKTEGVWDCQWQFAVAVNGLAITPAVNLVKNIGFGPEATHTLNENSVCKNLKIEEIQFPLSHPKFVIHQRGYDFNVFRLWHKAGKMNTTVRIKKMIPSPIKKTIKRTFNYDRLR